MASTVTLALALPGTARNSPAALLAGGTPGISRLVAGVAALGSPLVVLPCDEPSETSAATRPILVWTSIATTLDPLAIEARDWATVWSGGTVIPLALLDGASPASVMTERSTLAAWASVFVR